MLPSCSRRFYNNFFCALFHDLPEAVTRDIISPVKQATEGLPSIVKSIEDKIVASELVPLMEDFYRDEILYFTNDEFSNRICRDGKVSHVSFDELNTRYNEDAFSPVDGRIVRIADHYSALLEAELRASICVTERRTCSGHTRRVLLSAALMPTHFSSPSLKLFCRFLYFKILF